VAILTIPTLRRLWQEDHEFKASLGNIMRHYLKNHNNHHH
jgi:hypothetical protein